MSCLYTFIIHDLPVLLNRLSWEPIPGNASKLILAPEACGLDYNATEKARDSWLQQKIYGV